MKYQTIRYACARDVATITLDCPDRMNALNAAMRAEITHAAKAAETEARVLVLTGTGSAFCSGQDLADGRTLAGADLERVLREEYEPMLRAVAECRVPSIAAVNGAAAGAGASLALACDVVIATEGAIFLQAFARIGLMPDAGGTAWLPRQVGLARAMGAALFAEPVTARQAADWGMIWEAVPDGAFDAHWRARADSLAAGPSVAYRAIKQAMRQSFETPLEAQLDLEARLQGVCGRSRDFLEGVLAFAEKRPPRFEGR